MEWVQYLEEIAILLGIYWSIKEYINKRHKKEGKLRKKENKK